MPIAQQLKVELKELIVQELHLEGRDPATIGDDMLLFGEVGAGAGAPGLGLDSLDALQLATSIEERFGVRLPEGDDARAVFRSVSSLAAFIAAAPPGASGPAEPGMKKAGA